jgi:hypothetical protein
MRQRVEGRVDSPRGRIVEAMMRIRRAMIAQMADVMGESYSYLTLNNLDQLAQHRLGRMDMSNTS